MARGSTAKSQGKKEKSVEKRARKEDNKYIQQQLRWVLPTLGVLFVLVVIIILRAAWKPLPAPKVTAEELLRQAKAAAGKD